MYSEWFSVIVSQHKHSSIKYKNKQKTELLINKWSNLTLSFVCYQTYFKKNLIISDEVFNLTQKAASSIHKKVQSQYKYKMKKSSSWRRGFFSPVKDDKNKPIFS